jgi:hypothetical protein
MGRKRWNPVVVGISQAVPVQWVAFLFQNNRVVCFDVLVKDEERVHMNRDEICYSHHR